MSLLLYASLPQGKLDHHAFSAFPAQWTLIKKAGGIAEDVRIRPELMRSGENGKPQKGAAGPDQVGGSR